MTLRCLTFNPSQQSLCPIYNCSFTTNSCCCCIQNVSMLLQNVSYTNALGLKRYSKHYDHIWPRCESCWSKAGKSQSRQVFLEFCHGWKLVSLVFCVLYSISVQRVLKGVHKVSLSIVCLSVLVVVGAVSTCLWADVKRLTESMTPCKASNPSFTGKTWSLLSAIFASYRGSMLLDLHLFIQEFFSVIF